MIDLETLGTRADSVIMSIGAVRFDIDSDVIDDAAFYASVSIDSNLERRRVIQEDTMIWWLKQSAAAQKVFHEPKQDLQSSLEELADWLGTPDSFVWSNGADFDLPMLAHAYGTMGMDVPWKFWNSRCVRTFKSLSAAKGITSDYNGVSHNALDDAIKQASFVQKIHAALTYRIAA